MSNEQTHPLHATDKKIIDSLISKEIPEDFDFINLARLINRYDNFPGEIEIKEDIDKTLKFWNITKNNLIRPIQVARNINNNDFDITKLEENPSFN